MKILFAIAEAFPLIKVGGLADVGGALPKALVQRGHHVRVVLPGHPDLPVGRRVLSLDVPMGPVTERVEIVDLGHQDGAELLAVSHPDLVAAGAHYGGHGYQDEDVVPYVLYAKAVAALAAHPTWRPDVVHCHDWHTALVPLEMRGPLLRTPCEGIGTVLTIHNLAYQGRFGPEADMLVETGAEESGNLLAIGISTADVVNTVSRGYLEEILSPKYGMGLEGVLRARRGSLRAVLNGVDYETFDPRLDPHIAVRYGETFEAGKRANKRALQELSGLPTVPATPLLGMVARLVDQKGVGLLCDSLEALLDLDAQVVVMGTGDERYAELLTAAARRHQRLAYHPTSEESLARLVYAGSDVFLSPSAFEPCGLAPLVALRYGTIPVIRRTGGLRDTIPDHDLHPTTGLGFTFSERSPAQFVNAVRRALELRERTSQWRALQLRGMRADFSWDEPVSRYEELYREALDVRATPPPAQTRRRRPVAPIGPPTTRSAPLALVHHANQYLITDGYADRQGISEIVAGYTALLRLHEKYGVAANLHLSGTLVETVAWHAPDFLRLVRDLVDKGVVSLLGGTYSENVMTVFPADFNRRQLEESLWLAEHHLGVRPGDLRICWVPERVWDTAALAPVITDEGLANGGYRHVVLDDRLLHPVTGPGPGSPRARFDAAGPYGGEGVVGAGDPSVDPWRPYLIRDGGGLTLAPISADLRYCLPPSSPADWQRLEAAIATAAAEDGRLLVYADDLERAAGVGGWDHRALRRYEGLLRWLASRDDIRPVHLADWLERHPAAGERELQPGSFVELARGWAAGEDYRGWWDDPAWAPFRDYLEDARRAVSSAQDAGADDRLLRLAWKHLMACSYETAWHDPVEGGGTAPAPWAKAVASHARSCRVIADAARALGA